MTRLILSCAIGLGLFAGAAAVQADGASPGKPTTTYFSIGKTTACIGWNEYTTGDDCYSGTPTSYEVWRGLSPLTSSNLRYALSGSAVLIASGSCAHMGDQSVFVEGLNCSTVYYWALFLLDEDGNPSPPVIFSGTTLDCSSTTEVNCE